jgi:hypothetical protein
MAEPLTSSDLLRERMGFGVSPLASPETRRSYAAAGLSPLGTQDRERIAAGVGISPMAGPIETDAWKMTQYMTGQREQAPISYGGIGERPTGSSRRAIRMQDEWDKQQEARLKEEQMAVQADKEMRAQKTEDLKYSILEHNFEAKQKEESLQTKLQADLSSQRDNVFSALDNLDPRSSDFADQIADIRLKNSLAFSDPSVAGVVEQFMKVNNIYMGAQKEQQQKQEGLQEKFFSTQQSLLESGVSEDEIPQYLDTNAPAGVVRFDPNAVSKRLGTTKFEEKQATAEKKEDSPKAKATIDLSKAYGELNELLLSGADTDSARARVAGLREGYKALTGEEPPEILPQPKTPEQHNRIPSGQNFVGPDGKTYIKK